MIADRIARELGRQAGACPDIIDVPKLAEAALGTPDDQVKHAVATLIAVIRLLPEDKRHAALYLLHDDIREGVFRGE